ncbi:DUF1631 family protein [Solilutibacter silvestris]|uniref:DUF1631 domain-containing protein n=1 Tax=Solilutibacter silvestris TaxID=1645665 RepID=A0A2K1Q039_9GAMM|nr:DUF1631 family protein [Lysobacter silvestris]PNS08393.1 hypothetical protein Lysil_0022 [Lysobacter silvestris]
MDGLGFGQPRALPPRVQNAISKVMAACADGLAHPVRQALASLRDEMPLMIGNPSLATQDIILFSHCKHLSIKSGEVLPALLEQIEHELATIRDREQGPQQVDLWSSSAHWTLADAGENVAPPQAEGIGQVTNQCKLPLYLLGQRFGVLAGTPAFDADSIPVGPRRMIQAIDRASHHVFGEGFPHRLLTEALANALFHDYPALVGRINKELESASILPGLTFIPSLKRATSSRAPTEAHGEAEQAGYASGQSATPAVPHRQVAANADVGWFDQPEARSADARERFVGAVSSPGFAHARTLLAKAKGRGPQQANAGASNAVALPPHIVAELLDSLSSRDGNGRQLGIRHLHDELKARAKSLPGGSAQLSQQQTDSIELLGMLYETLFREMRTQSGALDLLKRLQIPLMRMALSGQEFFELPTHPGRQIMSRVAESGAAIAGEADNDPQFDAALTHAVKRVEEEYRGDGTVLEHIHEELAGAHQAHAQRSEAAERHQIEAARGHERIAVAREAAKSLIDQKLAGITLRPQIELLIRTAWQDALAFIRMRHDEHSDLWKRHERLSGRMLEIVTAADAVQDVDLQESIGEILKRTGYHAEEAGEVAHVLSRSAAMPRTGSRMSMTELVTMMRARPRFGESSQAQQLAAELPQPRNTREEECYRHVCTLPFGCWLDFTINQQGDVRRRRLSWYSRITGHALLVNRRGVRVADMQLDQLARLLASGQMHVARKHEMSLLDRAWTTTLGTLESLGRLFSGQMQAVA